MDKLEWLFEVMYWLSLAFLICIPVFYKTTKDSESINKRFPVTRWGLIFLASVAINFFCTKKLQNIDDNRKEAQRQSSQKQSDIKDSINTAQQNILERKIDSLQILTSFLESEFNKKSQRDVLSAEITQRGNIRKLRSAAIDLQTIRTEYMSTFFDSSDSRSLKERNIDFFTKSKIVLDSQLENSFLLKNVNLYNEWVGTTTGIGVYLGGALMPKQVKDWDQLFKILDERLFTVSSKTNYYCWTTLESEFLKLQNKKSKK